MADFPDDGSIVLPAAGDRLLGSDASDTNADDWVLFDPAGAPFAHTGDIVSGLDGITVIQAGVVTLAKMADMASESMRRTRFALFGIDMFLLFGVDWSQVFRGMRQSDAPLGGIDARRAGKIFLEVDAVIRS